MLTKLNWITFLKRWHPKKNIFYFKVQNKHSSSSIKDTVLNKKKKSLQLVQKRKKFNITNEIQKLILNYLRVKPFRHLWVSNVKVRDADRCDLMLGSNVHTNESNCKSPYKNINSDLPSTSLALENKKAHCNSYSGAQYFPIMEGIPFSKNINIPASSELNNGKNFLHKLLYYKSVLGNEHVQKLMEFKRTNKENQLGVVENCGRHEKCLEAEISTKKLPSDVDGLNLKIDNNLAIFNINDKNAYKNNQIDLASANGVGKMVRYFPRCDISTPTPVKKEKLGKFKTIYKIPKNGNFVSEKPDNKIDASFIFTKSGSLNNRYLKSSNLGRAVGKHKLDKHHNILISAADNSNKSDENNCYSYQKKSQNISDNSIPVKLFEDKIQRGLSNSDKFDEEKFSEISKSDNHAPITNLDENSNSDAALSRLVDKYVKDFVGEQKIKSHLKNTGEEVTEVHTPCENSNSKKLVNYNNESKSSNFENFLKKENLTPSTKSDKSNLYSNESENSKSNLDKILHGFSKTNVNDQKIKPYLKNIDKSMRVLHEGTSEHTNLEKLVNNKSVNASLDSNSDKILNTLSKTNDNDFAENESKPYLYSVLYSINNKKESQKSSKNSNFEKLVIHKNVSINTNSDNFSKEEEIFISEKIITNSNKFIENIDENESTNLKSDKIFKTHSTENVNENRETKPSLQGSNIERESQNTCEHSNSEKLISTNSDKLVLNSVTSENTNLKSDKILKTLSTTNVNEFGETKPSLQGSINERESQNTWENSNSEKLISTNSDKLVLNSVINENTNLKSDKILKTLSTKNVNENRETKPSLQGSISETRGETDEGATTCPALGEDSSIPKDKKITENPCLFVNLTKQAGPVNSGYVINYYHKKKNYPPLRNTDGESMSGEFQTSSSVKPVKFVNKGIDDTRPANMMYNPNIVQSGENTFRSLSEDMQKIDFNYPRPSFTINRNSEKFKKMGTTINVLDRHNTRDGKVGHNDSKQSLYFDKIRETSFEKGSKVFFSHHRKRANLSKKIDEHNSSIKLQRSKGSLPTRGTLKSTVGNKVLNLRGKLLSYWKKEGSKTDIRYLSEDVAGDVLKQFLVSRDIRNIFANRSSPNSPIVNNRLNNLKQEQSRLKNFKGSPENLKQRQYKLFMKETLKPTFRTGTGKVGVIKKRKITQPYLNQNNPHNSNSMNLLSTLHKTKSSSEEKAPPNVLRNKPKAKSISAPTSKIKLTSTESDKNVENLGVSDEKEDKFKNGQRNDNFNILTSGYIPLSPSPCRKMSKLVQACASSTAQISPPRNTQQIKLSQLQTQKDPEGKGNLDDSLVYTNQEKQPIFKCPKNSTTTESNQKLFDKMKSRISQIRYLILKKFNKAHLKKESHKNLVQNRRVIRKKVPNNYLKSLQEKQKLQKQQGTRIIVTNTTNAYPSYSEILTKYTQV